MTKEAKDKENSKGQKTTYSYDKAGRISKLTDEEGTITYTYDENGNVLTVTEEKADGSKTTVKRTYDKANRVTSYTDAEGNMTYGPLDGKMTEFVYDCRNRLIKAGDTEYSYDAENNRIAVTKDGVTTKYVVDSNCEYSQVLTATTDDSVITYIYGDGLIGQESEQDYVTYHYNQVGSTTTLTDEKGSIIETYEYSPYGDILDGDSSLTMFLYNGKYGVASDDNGLYYMRARYYDISIKRFVNQDVVIGHLDATSSLNRYAYCEGNPVSYLDPFGLEREDTTEFIIDAIQAGLAALSIVLCVTTAGAATPIVAVFINAVNTLIDSIRLLTDIDKLIDAIKNHNEEQGIEAATSIGKTVIDMIISSVINVDTPIHSKTFEWYEASSKVNKDMEFFSAVDTLGNKLGNLIWKATKKLKEKLLK